MRRLTRYFFEGLLFLIPVVATIYVIYIVFIKIDGLFKFPVPGMGFVITIAMITAIGFLGSNFLGKGLEGIVDKMFRRLPLVKLIYTSVKDLIGAFVGEKKGFTRPVMVRLFPGSNIGVLGFVTRESLEGLGIADSVAVYLPQSYNFAGNLVIVSREQVTLLKAAGGDVMTFIVSGGIAAREAQL
jgi:uncharacterized membrane protein